jgi:DNA-binding transcriptional regulator YiaG
LNDEAQIGSDIEDCGRPSPSTTNAFIGGQAAIPNNPLVAAALAAILKGGAKAGELLGGWTEQDGRVAYRHIGRKRGEIEVHAELRASDGAPASTEEQWAFVKTLSPLTADVLVMVLAQLCDPSHRGRAMYPSLLPIKVTANRLLGYKCYNRWGLERAQCRASFADEMRRLQSLRFDVRDYSGWDASIGRWNPRGLSVFDERLFEVAGERELSCAEQPDRLLDIAWMIRAGRWAEWWLNTRGTVWTSSIPARLLTLDHRRNRGIELLAKKIGLHMLLLWGAVRSRYSFGRRIDHLLEDIGELVAPAARDCHWAGRLRDRLDEAMLRLQECGLFAEVSWPNGRGPGDLDRSKGWVDHWLASVVHIRRPGGAASEEQTGAHAERTRKRRRRCRPAIKVPEMAGAEIRALRRERDLSQISLAERLGISTSYLSQLETGKRSLNEKMRVRLQPWIGAPEPAET